VALPTVIAKNQTGTAIDLPRLGLTCPASPGTITLTDFATFYEVTSEEVLNTRVAAGDIVINDGTSDLGTSEALAFLDATGNMNGPTSGSANALVKLSDTTGRYTSVTGVTIDGSDNLNLGTGNVTTTGTVNATTINTGGTPLALTDLNDVTITTPAQGDVFFRNGTEWVNLPAGTAGQFLQSGGAGANPSWVTGGGGTLDHAALTSNLLWSTSGHTGTASTFAAFTAGSAATNLTTSAAGDTSGTWPTLQVNDLTISGEVQGDVLYFNGTNWVRLPPGTDGEVLRTNGAGANPTWTAVGTLASRVDNITLTASSGSPYIETTSATYDTLAHIGFLGTNDNTPTQIAALIGQASP
jgi:hypothetical protein